MHRLTRYLIVWFVCGVISVIIGPVCGEQWANGTTGSQPMRARERQQHQQHHQQQQQQQEQQQQHQSQYQYVFSKPANKQQSNRGRSNNGLNELRRNLTQQKLHERQGDDPDHNSVQRTNSIYLIHQKIQQSDVSMKRTKKNKERKQTYFIPYSFTLSMLMMTKTVYFYPHNISPSQFGCCRCIHNASHKSSCVHSATTRDRRQIKVKDTTQDTFKNQFYSVTCALAL